MRWDLVRVFSSVGSIKERLQTELVKALRVRDAGRASIIRQIQAEIVKVEKAPAGITKVSEYEVLQRCARRWREAITEYEALLQGLQSMSSAEALDKREKISQMIEKETAELNVIRTFLPPPYPPEELGNCIDQTLLEVGLQAKHGDVMKMLLARLDSERVDKQELAGQVRLKLELLKSPSKLQ